MKAKHCLLPSPSTPLALILALAASLFLMFAVTAGAEATSASATSKRDQPGPYKVSAMDQDWTDTARSRTLPVRIYLPDGAPGPRPIIVWSHGLGGNRNAGETWGRHWASYGYISVHLQHPGSDESLWRGEIKAGDSGALKDLLMAARGEGSDDAFAETREAKDGKDSKDDKPRRQRLLSGGNGGGTGTLAILQKIKAAASPANAKLRAEDAKFALDKLDELNKTAGNVFTGRVDLTKAGICGHSFGGNTTLMAAGMAPNPLLGGKAPLKEPRYKAAIAFSAPPGRSFGDLAEVYAGITIPLMMWTGTEDKTPILGQTNPADRRRPYDNMKPGHKMLIILTGGDHAIFHGKRVLSAGKPGDAEHQRLIKEGTLAFWNAYLLGNSTDEAWLEKGGLAADAGKNATVEVK